MASLLSQLAEQAQASPDFPYSNGLRADYLARRLQGLPYSVPLRDRLPYVQELLRAGRNERCIVETERVLQAAYPNRGIDFETRPYYENLALAYLRLGEQENCIDRHNAESCIIPIAGQGVYQRRSGAEQAVDLFGQLLTADSSDLKARWLLNLAYMALGQYPEGVPAEWLILPSVFASEYPLPRFPDVAPALGLDTRGHAGGVSFEDFDGDGRLDIFATSYLLGEPARLFLNRGRAGFKEVSDRPGLQGITGGLNCTHADYDNDGDVDIFITRGAWLGNYGKIPNSLLRNQGNGTFEDVTAAAGLLSFYPSQVSAWADFDGDGQLDLFVGNESGGGQAHPCELYQNRGNGTFVNVAEETGLTLTAYVKGAVWGDINNDGRPDLFVSVLNGSNHLFLNQGSKGADGWQFEEMAQAAGVTEPKMSFPTWFFDYDNDGWEDLLVIGYEPGEEAEVAAKTIADYLGLPNQGITPRLYRNNGDGTFSDRTAAAGLDRVLYAMGANFGDLDNDGWLDFYLGTGEFSLWSVVPNRAFRNADGTSFLDVTTATGLGQIQKGHGVAFGDYDEDGDQDIFHVIGGAVEGDVYYNALYQNPGNSNSWITLRLEGTRANRSAIGARVRLVLHDADGEPRTLYRTVGTGGSFGANSLQLEIGLGTATLIDTLEIRWPGAEKNIETFTGLAGNTVWKITEGIRPQRIERK